MEIDRGLFDLLDNLLDLARDLFTIPNVFHKGLLLKIL